MSNATMRHLGTLSALLVMGSLALATGVGAQAIPDEPSFTPYTDPPRLLNVDEVREALIRAYPARLRDAGIGGRVNVWFYIDDTGTVRRRLLDQGSGNEQLDQAAMSVAEVFRFSAALNREQPVAVWVSLPITFQVRTREPQPN